MISTFSRVGTWSWSSGIDEAFRIGRRGAGSVPTGTRLSGGRTRAILVVVGAVGPLSRRPRSPIPRRWGRGSSAARAPGRGRHRRGTRPRRDRRAPRPAAGARPAHIPPATIEEKKFHADHGRRNDEPGGHTRR